MKCCTYSVLLILSVVLCAQSRVKCSSVDTFNMMINNTTNSINLSWERPDQNKSKLCYKTHVQYRSHCDTSWKNYSEIPGFSFELPAPDMKKNYAFRLRMRLECTQKSWGEWSPVKNWGSDTHKAPCITKTSSFTVKDYLLITMLPLTGFMLVYALTHDRVRRLVLPIIPDPKHTQERILNIEQIQWWSNFAQTCEDCKISEIKICDREEEKTDITLIKSDLDEQPPHTHPTHAVPGKQGFQLATNNSMYCIYSSDTSEDNIVAQCTAIRPGYIII
ncbi:cytokine receptor-like factor 2 [Neoarius graeffei]|uniref:cytokine receptor-like factor 2 n=1 Tax=Neoarius graeffei TaxID=443677 RepID=UPI00298CA518|nr:cytokine receptor-like factor 2 [Neoarius graeffei]